MSAFDQALALGVLVLVVVGLIRAMRGPSRYDRMLAMQFTATGVIAILLLLGVGLRTFALVDVALVIALFAAIAGIALVRRPGRTPEKEP